MSDRRGGRSSSHNGRGGHGTGEDEGLLLPKYEKRRWGGQSYGGAKKQTPSPLSSDDNGGRRAVVVGELRRGVSHPTSTSSRRNLLLGRSGSLRLSSRSLLGRSGSLRMSRSDQLEMIAFAEEVEEEEEEGEGEDHPSASGAAASSSSSRTSDAKDRSGAAASAASAAAVRDGGGGPSSRRSKFRRMSSVVLDGYALIDAMHEDDNYSDDEQHRGDDDEEAAAIMDAQSATEPFISSLAKSVEILGGYPSAMVTLFGESEEEGGGAERRKQRKGPSRTALLAAVLHLSAFSVLGTALRVFLGRLFGGECGKVHATWLYPVVSSLNLCVTSDGSASSQPPGGGALFTDLPANVVGSFVMGLLQPSQDLGLLNAMPVAFLSSDHWFQSWEVVHLALRTGFCGSLTTLASWNTQMVVMIVGAAGDGGRRQSRFFSAMFGYVIGLMAATSSLALGRTVAIWAHRRANPRLAKEEDMLVFAYSKGINGPSDLEGTSTTASSLPDYERRYLASLLPHEKYEWAKKNVSALEDLERWAVSTDRYRGTGGGGDVADSKVLAALHRIERKVLVDDERDLGEDLLRTAQRMGWDVVSLRKFAERANDVTGPSVSPSSKKKAEVRFVVQALWIAVPFVMAASLLAAFAILRRSSAESSEFYSSMWLSSLFAPFGTLLRWKLASLNGSLGGYWEWFPLGTFAANIIASLVSASAKGCSDSSVIRVLTPQMASGIKTGFAGSMSTVSTFVAECDMLQKTFPHHAKAHYYMVGTLAAACVLGFITYSTLLHS